MKLSTDESNSLIKTPEIVIQKPDILQETPEIVQTPEKPINNNQLSFMCQSTTVSKDLTSYIDLCKDDIEFESKYFVIDGQVQQY